MPVSLTLLDYKYLFMPMACEGSVFEKEKGRKEWRKGKEFLVNMVRIGMGLRTKIKVLPTIPLNHNFNRYQVTCSLEPRSGQGHLVWSGSSRKNILSVLGYYFHGVSKLECLLMLSSPKRMRACPSGASVRLQSKGRRSIRLGRKCLNSDKYIAYQRSLEKA